MLLLTGTSEFGRGELTADVHEDAAMPIFDFVLILLACAPVISVVLFRKANLERRKKTLLDDLKKVNAEVTPLVRGWGGASGIAEEVAVYFSRTAVLPPAIVLTVFYCLGFFLCCLYLNTKYRILPAAFVSPRLWALPFATDSRAIVFAFVGVYLFNLGSSVRRIYLYDLSENLFWGNINRLGITIGLAILIQTLFTNEFVFFSIGFLADTVLADVLKRAVTVLKMIRGTRTPELSLKLVQGLDMWKEYRLHEEGIENVENLATADVVELAVKTHYSLHTLVDWIDQAILIVRLRERVDKLVEAGLDVSAVEFAWRAPENGGNPELLQTIAKICGMDPLILADMTSALYGDDYVRTLWQLWQGRIEFDGDVAKRTERERNRNQSETVQRNGSPNSALLHVNSE